MLFGINDLKSKGFMGFLRIGEMNNKAMKVVPDQRGVYVICRDDNYKVSFLKRNMAGKGEDHTVPMDNLKENWIENALVIYIGKAGGISKNGAKSNQTLRGRIYQLIIFGKGKVNNHKGGKMIWQLKNHDDLLIAYKPLYEDNPVLVECEMLNLFKINHNNKLPFANLKVGC